LIIDPVLETTRRDLQQVQDLGVKLLYVLETHLHADHVTGASELRAVTGAWLFTGDCLLVEDFIKLMAAKRPPPARMPQAIAANLRCGRAPYANEVYRLRRH
jgi:phosphoribosyl 1,2-cyclic phosphodiesterase